MTPHSGARSRRSSPHSLPQADPAENDLEQQRLRASSRSASVSSLSERFVRAPLAVRIVALLLGSLLVVSLLTVLTLALSIDRRWFSSSPSPSLSPSVAASALTSPLSVLGTREGTEEVFLPLSTRSVLAEDRLELDRLVYRVTAESDSAIPAIVAAFRAGSVDWHTLLPTYPASGNGALDLERLKATERAVTRLLVYDHNLHSRWGWGREHGPLASFTLCPSLRDKCAIHTREECTLNGLCGWCAPTRRCVDRFQTRSAYENWDDAFLLCPAPLQLSPAVTSIRSCHPESAVLYVDSNEARRYDNEAVLGVNQKRCAHYVPDSYAEIRLNGDAQAMFYHFITEHLSPVFSARFSNTTAWPSVRSYTKLIQLIVTEGDISQYHDIYGVFTAFCPRAARDFLTGQLCFCDTVDGNGSGVVMGVGSGEVLPASMVLPQAPSLTDFIVRGLGLEDVHPPRSRLSLVLVSRQQKRFVLNELELIREAHALNVSARLLPIEFMTLYEQVREFRRSHVIVGMHGSGLTNFLFLHGDDPSQLGFPSVGVQLMPWKVTRGSNFFRLFADGQSARYMEWTNSRREASVLHPHFLGVSGRAELSRKLSATNDQIDSNAGEFFAFWINQDTVVDVEWWRRILGQLLDGVSSDDEDNADDGNGVVDDVHAGGVGQSEEEENPAAAAMQIDLPPGPVPPQVQQPQRARQRHTQQ